MTLAYLGLGTNLGNRERNLHEAVERLDATPGVRIAKVSAFYDTAPVGPPQPRYLNAACGVETSLTPTELLKVAHAIEDAMGRVRAGERWGPRIIDVDLLFYGSEVVEQEDLSIPHPRAALREFVLSPMAEIAPDFEHPVLHRTMRQLLEDCLRDAEDDHDG